MQNPPMAVMAMGGWFFLREKGAQVVDGGALRHGFGVGTFFVAVKCFLEFGRNLTITEFKQFARDLLKGDRFTRRGGKAVEILVIPGHPHERPIPDGGKH